MRSSFSARRASLRRGWLLAAVMLVLAAMGSAWMSDNRSATSSARQHAIAAPTAREAAHQIGPCSADLAYSQMLPPNGDNVINMRDLCTGNFRQIKTGRQAAVSVPSLSPDGSMVAYSSGNLDQPESRLYVADTKTGAVRELRHLAGAILSPVFSPDGKTIAFLHGAPPDSQPGIYTIHRDGTSLQLVLPATKYDQNQATHLNWTPDGKALIYPEAGIHRANLGGSEPSTVWSGQGFTLTGPAFIGSNGNTFYFQGQKGTSGGMSQLWSCPLECKTPKQLTQVTQQLRGYTLAEFGNSLYYSVSRGPDPSGDTDVYALNLINNRTSRLFSAKNASDITTPLVSGADRRNIVALGDSYSSGEGAPVKSADGKVRYIAGTDTDTNKCHRSMAAYPVLLHEELNHDLGLEFHACSGATIKDFWESFYEDRRKNPEEDPQLEWINSRTEIVTLTIGGNDVSFADVMDYCARQYGKGAESPCKKTWEGAVRSGINNLIAKGSRHDDLPSLYAEIRRRASEAQVFVIGYPRFFPADPPDSCPTGVPVRTFSRSDMRWINSEIANLNDQIKKLAESASFTFVDVFDSLKGHEVCTNKSWINRALVHWKLDPNKQVQSFHPNVAGHKAIVGVVVRYIR
ncbi:GDSL-type esterase/lipase family protein [Streptomyces sp. NPDC049541]|uniref:GDSL-type esterase/lipase family protein n=1 Tax=Streptomyces sp. NPDC049541 TaxID=3365594 RepID=UPI0037B04B26